MAGFSRSAYGLSWLLLGLASVAWGARGGVLTLDVVDHQTKQPLAARLHLFNAAGRNPKIPKAPFWHDHIALDGLIALKLPNGNYRFELECGPEYLDQQGHFQINDFADDTKTIEMTRFVNMADEGWYSGDLDVRRPVKDLELLMRADDLHVAHLFASSNKSAALPDKPSLFDGNRYYRSVQGEPVWRDAREGAALDLPMRVAAGEIDSLELASWKLERGGVSQDEKACLPRDETLFPPPDGPARWREKIYFHLLECGLRIPPTAGSGSGVAPNPIGYNRLYVHLDGEFSYEKWLEGLRAGRVVVTNGPMIRPTVEGEFPGFTFRATPGDEVELEVGVNLATREKIDYLEIVQNGRAHQQIRLAEFKKAGGKLPPVKFTESGWFLLRVVTNNQKTHRFAMTAPYFVEFDNRPRISLSSAQFFLDWATKQGDAAAMEFWTQLVDRANAD